MVLADLFPRNVIPANYEGWQDESTGFIIATFGLLSNKNMAACHSCRLFEHIRIADSLYEFHRPSELLKHLMDHKLAGHRVKNESFESLHHWIRVHGSDTF